MTPAIRERTQHWVCSDSDMAVAKRALCAVRRAELAAIAPDARRIIRDRRMMLETAVRLWDPEVVSQARAAVDVAAAWEGY